MSLCVRPVGLLVQETVPLELSKVKSSGASGGKPLDVNFIDLELEELVSIKLLCRLNLAPVILAFSKFIVWIEATYFDNGFKNSLGKVKVVSKPLRRILDVGFGSWLEAKSDTDVSVSELFSMGLPSVSSWYSNCNSKLWNGPFVCEEWICCFGKLKIWLSGGFDIWCYGKGKLRKNCSKSMSNHS